MDRRNFIKAGVGGAAAALVPRRSEAKAKAGVATALAQLRADYEARVRAVADHLRDSFAKVNEFEPENVVAHAAERLEAVCNDVFCLTIEDARSVFAVSPHWDFDDWFESFDDIRRAMTVCAALDVATAMGARWYIRLNTPISASDISEMWS